MFREELDQEYYNRLATQPLLGNFGKYMDLFSKLYKNTNHVKLSG